MLVTTVKCRATEGAAWQRIMAKSGIYVTGHMQEHGYAVCEMDEALLRAYRSGLTDIGAATCPKPPRVWATLSDSSITKASRISGKMGLSSPLLISGYTPMTPLWST